MVRKEREREVRLAAQQREVERNYVDRVEERISSEAKHSLYHQHYVLAHVTTDYQIRVTPVAIS